MHATVQTAVLYDASTSQGSLLAVVAVDFGALAEPLTLDDQIREASIQVEGLKEHICMLEFAKTLPRSEPIGLREIGYE